mgnify:CR=1 FL=1
MADNNYDPKEVGGIQPIHCPYCLEEIKPLDSFHLSLQNKRYHYPECWQRHELDGDPPPKAPAAKSMPPPAEIDENEHTVETYHGGKSKKK